jgi:MFS family permease
MLSVTSASHSLAHTDQVGVSWVLTACLLSSALLTPVIGNLGDRHGKRLVAWRVIPMTLTPADPDFDVETPGQEAVEFLDRASGI